MANNKKWIILTSGDRSLQDIATDLKNTGFAIEYVLDAIGQITGEASDEMKRKAEKIAGVTDIIPSHDDIHLGDPEAPVTW